MKRSIVAVAVLGALNVSAAEPCENARIRETAPLATATAQDKVVAGTFSKAATTCAERGPACDQARAECGALLTTMLQRQVGFDEGVWLRDLLLPYLGQQYPMSRPFGAFTVAPDASCNVDVATLTAAAQRRTDQAARREVLLQEYGLYVKWAQAAQQRCRERVAADDQRAAAAKAESEKLAVVAVTAGAADQAKRQAEEAARKKAEEAKLAQEAAARAAVDEAKRREEAELRLRQERLDAEKRAQQAQIDAEQRNRQALLEAEQRMRAERERERRELEQQAKLVEEARLVKERSERTAQLKTQKEQLLADADSAYKRALAEEAQKKQAAVDAISQNPAVAQAAVAEAAQANQARVEAERNLEAARVQASRMQIDDSYERARGHVALLGGGGVFSYSDGTTASTGGALGFNVTAHFGFWAEAPASGLANGFELALSARFVQALGPAPTPREFEGHFTARYFFGPFGIGGAGEYRNFEAVFGIRPFGIGPSVGLALIDSPHTRAIFSLNWMPVGTAVDLARVGADLEVSYEWFTLRFAGGSFTQQFASASRISWQGAVFVGARLRW